MQRRRPDAPGGYAPCGARSCAHACRSWHVPSLDPDAGRLQVDVTPPALTAAVAVDVRFPLPVSDAALLEDLAELGQRRRVPDPLLARPPLVAVEHVLLRDEGPRDRL